MPNPRQSCLGNGPKVLAGTPPGRQLNREVVSNHVRAIGYKAAEAKERIAQLEKHPTCSTTLAPSRW